MLIITTFLHRCQTWHVTIIDRELLKYSKHAAKEGRTEDTLTIYMRFNSLSISIVTVLLIKYNFVIANSM